LLAKCKEVGVKLTISAQVDERWLRMYAPYMQRNPPPHDAAPSTNAAISRHPNLRPQTASEVTHGWDSIVAVALEHIAVPSEASGVPIKVAQIKQKMGNLRLDVDEDAAGPLEIVEKTAAHTHLRSSTLAGSARERAAATVDAATARSATVCEASGGDGRLRKGTGWLHRACASHAAGR